MHQSLGKKNVPFRLTSSYLSIIPPFRILIGRFQNLLKTALMKNSMVGYFKCSK